MGTEEITPRRGTWGLHAWKTQSRKTWYLYTRGQVERRKHRKRKKKITNIFSVGSRNWTIQVGTYFLALTKQAAVSYVVGYGEVSVARNWEKFMADSCPENAVLSPITHKVLNSGSSREVEGIFWSSRNALNLYRDANYMCVHICQKSFNCTV